MCFHIGFCLNVVNQYSLSLSLRVRKLGGGDKLSLSAIIKSNLYLSEPANGLNYFVLTSEVLFLVWVIGSTSSKN